MSPKTIIPAHYRPIKGSHRSALSGAKRVGPADPNEVVLVTIYLRRRPDGPPLPTHEYWSKTPPGRRTFVRGDEFAQLYGASQEDINNVVAFAQTQGLKIIKTNLAGRQVTVSGTVAQMNAAFAVDLGSYESPAQKYRGREGSVYLPSDLIDLVQSVLGLDNRKVMHPMNGAPAGAVALTPLQVAQAYGFHTPMDATGQTIGIIVLSGGYQQSDIQTFLQGLGLAMPTITDIPVTGNTLGGISAISVLPTLNWHWTSK